MKLSKRMCAFCNHTLALDGSCVRCDKPSPMDDYSGFIRRDENNDQYVCRVCQIARTAGDLMLFHLLDKHNLELA